VGTCEDLPAELVTERLAPRQSAGGGSGARVAADRAARHRFIGYCGLTVGQGSPDEPEIAYELAQRAHGHGYATEAARAVVEAATRTGRRRLWATVREWNAPSFRVLEKLDFHRSDRITEDAEHGNTIWLTRVLHPR
jgi:RimJ/RimL family protein N-acetyltransferase